MARESDPQREILKSFAKPAEKKEKSDAVKDILEGNRGRERNCAVNDMIKAGAGFTAWVESSKHLHGDMRVQSLDKGIDLGKDRVDLDKFRKDFYRTVAMELARGHEKLLPTRTDAKELGRRKYGVRGEIGEHIAREGVKGARVFGEEIGEIKRIGKGRDDCELSKPKSGTRTDDWVAMKKDGTPLAPIEVKTSENRDQLAEYAEKGADQLAHILKENPHADLKGGVIVLNDLETKTSLIATADRDTLLNAETRREWLDRIVKRLGERES